MSNSVSVGLNTNVDLHGRVLHVQTEDYGSNHPVLVTQVFADTGQVVRQVRFDYAKHLDHANLRAILSKAMKAQHGAVIRELHEQAGYITQELLPDVTPEPYLIADPNPPVSTGQATDPECVHQKVDGAIWDKLVARAQQERQLRRSNSNLTCPVSAAESSANIRDLRSVDATPPPTPHCEWDDVVEHRRLESSSEMVRGPIPDADLADPGEAAARAAYNTGLESLKAKDLEAALVAYAMAVQYQPGNRKYRASLRSLLLRMDGG